jgi:hypothetical protein
LKNRSPEQELLLFREGRFLSWLLVLAIWTGGCARGGGLHFEKTGSIQGHGNLPPQIIEAIDHVQQVTASATSTGGPITVYALLLKDLEGFLEQLPAARIRVPVLGKTESAKDVSISAAVPARHDVAVVVVNEGGKATSVTLRIDAK